MRIEIQKISLNDTISKIEVTINFGETKTWANQTGLVRVLIDNKNQTIEELKAEAVKAAKELLTNAANAVTE